MVFNVLISIINLQCTFTMPYLHTHRNTFLPWTTYSYPWFIVHLIFLICKNICEYIQNDNIFIIRIHFFPLCSLNFFLFTSIVNILQFCVFLNITQFINFVLYNFWVLCQTPRVSPLQNYFFLISGIFFQSFLIH